jgi:transcriptional regulator with XRE-family HTH domain
MLREEMGLMQKDLAEKLSMAKTTYNNYEKGKREPDIETIKHMAEFFDVSTDYLLGKTDERKIVVMKGNEIPKELIDVGVEYLTVLKDIKDKGIPPEHLQTLIDAVANFSKGK